MAALSLFYCYASEDEALCDQLEKHLRQLQRQGLISTWHERKILAGEARAHEVDTHLETASIILLLVSPDFLSSDYCYDVQMQRALERHRHGAARVIPLILRPCDWQHSPLQDLQCLPRDGKPVAQWSDLDEVFHTITQDLRRLIEQQQALAHPPVPLLALDRQNRIRILKQVRAIWIDGLLKQSLHQAARIELHLQDRPDVLANPWRLQVQELDQAPQTLPDETSIVDVYDSAGGELLILGEPGAGKTTLLLELTRTLLERAEQDEQIPMPIVFHLSSWAEKRQALSLWLVEELATKYQVPRKIGKTWIDTDQVLPLLDGLDEVAKDARTACVEQINDYYRARLEGGSSPIVVCCRSEEYATLSTHVMLQRAVSILPLTSEQIDAYLEQAGEQVEALRQALNEDVELHSLACQPLMLNIFAFAYQGVSEVPIGVTGEEMRSMIFAQYVEHMLERRGQSRHWKPEQVIDWLTFLAMQMHRHDQTVFSVENLRPTWLSRKWRILYQWCIGLLFGLFGGMLLGMFFSNRVFGLVFGLVGGLVGGLNTWINPAGVLTRSWKEIRYVLIVALVTELIGLSIILVGGWLVFGLVDLFFLIGGWGFSLFLGLVGGLVFGLVGPVGMDRLGLELARKELLEHPTFSPNDHVWRIVRTELLGGMAFGLLFGVVFGLVLMLPVGFIMGLFFSLSSASGPVTGLLLGPLIGLFFGLFFGILFGLLVGVEGFMKHFILRFFLALRGDLPWNLVPFLDEAAERLLLRKVGGSYIFVHRLLMDYFADLEENISD